LSEEASALEPGTKEYDAAMAAKADESNNPAPDADDSVSSAAAPVRPEGVPEKFWNAETGEVDSLGMAKAYRELEAKLSGKKDSDENVSEDDAKEALASKGIKSEEFDSWVNEFAETGEVSESTYERLESLGLGKEVVDAYIEGQKARADLATAQLLEPVGGQEAFDKMSEWAGANWDKAEVEAFNAAMEGTDNAQKKLSMLALKEAYVKANGSEPSLVGGESTNLSGGGYESVAQMKKDMASPEYAEDPAFRKKVMEKMRLTDESILYQ
jgi:hypothetical protein